MSALTKVENIQEHSTELMINDLEKMQHAARKLMQSKHYQKMGEEGIFAIIQKAKSIGLNPLEALNGGMYYVQGKVEMQGQQMLAVIRSHGHSVTLDPKSTSTNVIMHGKRKDNGDTWTVSFGIEDAKRAGIYRGQWEKYPTVMCKWRCVSELGRFLFSDILKGVYVKGEIRGEDSFDELEELKPVYEKEETISTEQAIELAQLLTQCSPAVQENFKKYFQDKFKIEILDDLPLTAYEMQKKALQTRAAEYQKYLVEQEMNNVLPEAVE